MRLEDYEKQIIELEQAQGRELALARKLLGLIKENQKVIGLKHDEEWPKVGDEYFIAVDNEEAYKIRCSNDAYDNYNLETGNCHRTEEAAEAYRAWITDPRTQARRMIEMCEGFDSDGPYAIVWKRDYRFKGVKTIIDYAGYFDGSLRFNIETRSQAAIDKLGEDLIKVALGVITGDEAREIVMHSMRSGV